MNHYIHECMKGRATHSTHTRAHTHRDIQVANKGRETHTALITGEPTDQKRVVRADEAGELGRICAWCKRGRGEGDGHTTRNSCPLKGKILRCAARQERLELNICILSVLTSYRPGSQGRC